MSQEANLITNPLDLPQGSFIITGGMYGSGQERILVHTGGLPTAPPSSQQLSPVFILPPQQQPQQPESQYARNMTMKTGKRKSPTYSEDEEGKTGSVSLPSFGSAADDGYTGGNGYKKPLLPSNEEAKITRTPLPVIGGRCST